MTDLPIALLETQAQAEHERLSVLHRGPQSNRWRELAQQSRPTKGGSPRPVDPCAIMGDGLPGSTPHTL